MHAKVCIWRSEDSLNELILLSHLSVGSEASMFTSRASPLDDSPSCLYSFL